RNPNRVVDGFGGRLVCASGATDWRGNPPAINAAISLCGRIVRARILAAQSTRGRAIALPLATVRGELAPMNHAPWPFLHPSAPSACPPESAPPWAATSVL